MRLQARQTCLLRRSKILGNFSSVSTQKLSFFDLFERLEGMLGHFYWVANYSINKSEIFYDKIEYFW